MDVDGNVVVSPSLFFSVLLSVGQAATADRPTYRAGRFLRRSLTPDIAAKRGRGSESELNASRDDERQPVSLPSLVFSCFDEK